MAVAKHKSARPVAFAVALMVLVALAVPFGGAALATHTTNTGGTNNPDVIDLSPPTDSAPAGTCNEFAITATETTGSGGAQVAEGETIDIRASQSDGDNIEDLKIAFCDPDAGGNASDLSGPSPATPGGAQTGGGGVASGDCDDENNTPNNQPGNTGCDNVTGTEAPALVHEECMTGPDGTCRFGLTSNEAGTMTVTACFETASQDDNCANEPINDSATKTWTAGGQEAARNITCEPATASNPEGDTHIFRCTVTDGSGAALNNVTVSFDVTAGPNAEEQNPQTCGPTDSQGRTSAGGTSPDFTGTGASDCDYTDATGAGSPPGTDTITVWVQQAAGGTGGADASEPKTTITKTWTGPARTLDCEPETATNNPGTSHTITCTARDVSGNLVSGVVVNFTESGPGRISSSTQDTTDSTGRAEVVVTSSTNETGDQTVTGTVATGQPAATECARLAGDPTGAPAGACADSVTKSWQVVTQSPPPPPPPTQCSDEIDNDGDGEVDLQDAGCIGPQDDTEAGETEENATTLTIRYDRPNFKGQVASDRKRCQVGRRIILKKVTPGPNRTVGTDTSDRRGNWEIRKRRARGRFYAIARPKRFVDAFGTNVICLRDRSVTIKVGRRR